MEHIYKQSQFGELWFTYPSFYSFIVNKFPSESHFVEIGSWKGKSSAYMAVEIANSGKKIKFDCVDTWLGSPEHTNDDYVKTNTLYELFLNNMKPVSNYFCAIRKSSEEASKLYEDKSLDFVFIDAEHSYDAVIHDIKLWEPKIKNGGIISGHDYYSWPTVTQAVDHYYGSNVIPFEKEKGTFVWYVQK